MINLITILKELRRKLQDGTLTFLDVVHAINALSQLIIDLSDGVPVPMGDSGPDVEQCQLDVRDQVLGLVADVDGIGSEPEVPISGPFIDALLPIALKIMLKLLEKWVAK